MGRGWFIFFGVAVELLFMLLMSLFFHRDGTLGVLLFGVPLAVMLLVGLRVHRRKVRPDRGPLQV